MISNADTFFKTCDFKPLLHSCEIGLSLVFCAAAEVKHH